MNLNSIVYAFIVLLIGVTLVSPMFAGSAQYSNTTAGAKGENVTGTTGLMVPFIPLFFVLILIGIGVSYIRFSKH